MSSRPDLPPPLLLCATYSGSWSGPAVFKSASKRGYKIQNSLTSALFMFSKIKKAPKKSVCYKERQKERTLLIALALFFCIKIALLHKNCAKNSARY